MIPRALLLLAALCGLLPGARADEPPGPPPQADRQQQGTPLSAEDAEIVRQLALLEQVDLLRNLDLFEPPPPDSQPAQPPDAGQP